MDWFLYDIGLRHDRVKQNYTTNMSNIFDHCYLHSTSVDDITFHIFSRFLELR